MADTGTILTRADSDAWRIACEREPIIRALVAMPRVSRTAILDAGTELSLSRTRIFELVARYRADPVTSSLLDRAPGFPKGQRRLDPERDQIIAAEIEGYYLTRPNRRSRSLPAGSGMCATSTTCAAPPARRSRPVSPPLSETS